MMAPLSPIQQKLKILRQRRKKAVTIVAGFKCEGGVVLCADTQETAEDIKLWVEKLSYYEETWCQAGFGGSGHGDMVDMLVERVKAELDRGYDNIGEVRDCIRLALQEGYENEINIHPYAAEDKVVNLLIAVRPGTQQSVTLLKANGPVLHEVPAYEVIGVGELVRYIAKNLHRNDLPLGQGVVLGIHLVSLAKKYVDSVGGDTHVLVITSDGRIGFERVEDSQKQEQFFEQFNEALKDLTLSCPDTSISNEQIYEKLEIFVESVKELRERHFDDVLQTSLRRALTEPDNKGDIYSRLPIGQSSIQGSDVPAYEPAPQYVQDLARLVQAIERGEELTKETAKPKRKTPAKKVPRPAKKRRKRGMKRFSLPATQD